MYIQPIADIHIEMAPCDIPVIGDLVVLAGDIGIGVEGVRWAKEQFDGTPTIYVAGNHTYYGHVFPDTIADLRVEAEGSSVHVLENDEIVLDGVRFLGATLWTDYCLQGLAQREFAMATAKHGMNDFRQIHKASGELLHPRDIAQAHAETVEWLRGRLSEPSDEKTVVVTHHAPCMMNISPQHRLNGLTPAFASNLDNLILDFNPTLWISGHTHYCCDYHIGETRVVSNQRGYAGREKLGFNPTMTIEI